MERTNIMTGAHSMLLHSVVLPIFFLLFIVFYEPFDVVSLLTMKNSSFTFNVTMLFCILLVSISLTRSWLYFIGKVRNLLRIEYAGWCLAEVLITSVFMALYLSLMMSTAPPYYELVGKALKMTAATCIYPYLFFWVGIEAMSKINSLAHKSDDTSLIRFYDEYKKLRFIIAPEAVLFIKSEDNYAQINYLDKGKPKKFILRSSMKALEDTLKQHGLIRCHRSYFVNPSFIKIVHRNNAGLIVAELNQEGYESIPISQKYQDQIAKIVWQDSISFVMYCISFSVFVTAFVSWYEWFRVMLLLVAVDTDFEHRIDYLFDSHTLTKGHLTNYLVLSFIHSSKGGDYDGDGFEHPNYDEDGEW